MSYHSPWQNNASLRDVKGRTAVADRRLNTAIKISVRRPEGKLREWRLHYCRMTWMAARGNRKNCERGWNYPPPPSSFSASQMLFVAIHASRTDTYSFGCWRFSYFHANCFFFAHLNISTFCLRFMRF